MEMRIYDSIKKGKFKHNLKSHIWDHWAITSRFRGVEKYDFLCNVIFKPALTSVLKADILDILNILWFLIIKRKILTDFSQNFKLKL